MKRESSLSKYGVRVRIGLLASLAICFPTQIQAQAAAAGNNAVYNSTPALVSSASYVDASVMPGSDICAQIYNALSASTISAAGAIIDARGINSGNSSSNLTCTSGTPWVQGSNSTTFPATVLLPSGTITISATWILPNKTRIVGEGQSKTIIQAVRLTDAPMIEMGSSSGGVCPTGGCTGVEVADLALSGQNLAGLSGISNTQSQDMSTVRNVVMSNISGTGLSVSGSGAQNSGPYSDILFANASPVLATVCADFNGVSTHGILGLSCSATGGTKPTVAVLLDGSNNSLEDVVVQGFGDGVLIGSNAVAQSDTLLNIAGGSGVTNVIHISTNNVANNLSILGVASQGASNSIADDLTGNTLSDKSVAMYVLGAAVKAGSTTVGYTRFTTSPSVPTWAVENTTITNPSGSCISGSILSNLEGVSGNTLWVCTSNGTWTNAL